MNPARFLAMAKSEYELGPATVAKYMVALSQFGQWLHTEELLGNGNYISYKRRLDGIRGRTPERALPTVPPERAFQAVIAEARKDTGGTIRQNLERLRNIALLEALRSTGCRVAELVNMKCGDIAGNRIIITGKGNKQRVAFLDPAAMDALETYLSLRGSRENDRPVLARHDRRAKGIAPISTTSVRNVVNKMAVAAGVDPQCISPHKFRHRFATRVLEGTGNLAVVQDLLGHSSPATTRIYARLSSGQLAAAHDSVSL